MTASHPPTAARSPSDTPPALLDAAVAVFAEHGYARATVREIVERAGANIAAVNYHFGDKATLYARAMDHCRATSNTNNPLVQADAHRDFNADRPPADRLYLFVRTMLGHMFRDGQLTDLARMMGHEMQHPTPALDRLVDLSVRRVYDALIQIIRDLLPADANPALAERAAFAAMAQTHHHHLAHPLVARLHPEQRYTETDLDDLARQITDFTLHGLGIQPPEHQP